MQCLMRASKLTIVRNSFCTTFDGHIQNRTHVHTHADEYNETIHFIHINAAIQIGYHILLAIHLSFFGIAQSLVCGLSKLWHTIMCVAVCVSLVSLVLFASLFMRVSEYEWVSYALVRSHSHSNNGQQKTKIAERKPVRNVKSIN